MSVSASLVQEGTLLWEPSTAFKDQTAITRYMRWLAEHRGLRFDRYADLWSWSVSDLPGFWSSMWEFFHVQASAPYTAVLGERTMPGAEWFPGARLNYAEHILRNATDERPALLFQSERQPLVETSWADLTARVAAVATALRGMGVAPGDRVVAFMPNIPETIVAFLAAASLGAVWSSCSPDFGTQAVIDRFAQIEPTVLFAVDGYQYGGKAFDRMEELAALQRALPTLKRTVLVPYLSPTPAIEGLTDAVLWADVLATPAEPLRFEQVPFGHPLWILYSSGTTGLPKPIVQGHGGILLELLKAVGIQKNVQAGDRLFWFTTTGWMMWNFLVGGLLVGATIVLYDGSPAYPDAGVIWRLAEQSGMTALGTSPGFMQATQRAGIVPREAYDLSRLKSIGSTGSPLPPELFGWVYEQVKPDVWLASVSGGTDVCTAFLGGCPLLPVRAGELQCRALGCKVEAFDESGQPVIGEVGELVITEPMPSMPLYFWHDEGNARYRESYFATFPGVWRHGDWIKITPEGGAAIYGRSDSTLNRQGVRMGTSDIYRVVEADPDVVDSLVLGVELPNGRYYMPLFVVLREGATLDDALRARLNGEIRTALSPRHVPDEIVQIADVPRTLNSKKLEVPIKKLLLGIPPERALNPGATANPHALDFFVEFARAHASGGSVLPPG
jgi:acetoacetyl-CoA synthetase